jgi:hypothetical protein
VRPPVYEPDNDRTDNDRTDKAGTAMKCSKGGRKAGEERKRINREREQEPAQKYNTEDAKDHADNHWWLCL